MAISFFAGCVEPEKPCDESWLSRYSSRISQADLKGCWTLVNPSLSQEMMCFGDSSFASRIEYSSNRHFTCAAFFVRDNEILGDSAIRESWEEKNGVWRQTRWVKEDFLNLGYAWYLVQDTLIRAKWYSNPYSRCSSRPEETLFTRVDNAAASALISHCDSLGFWDDKTPLARKN